MIGDRTILVLASDAAAVDARCLAATGLAQGHPVIVRGMDASGPFRRQVFEAGVLDDVPAIVAQARRIVREAVTANPETGAICIECGELSLSSEALRAGTGLPVFDYRTAADQLMATIGRGTEPP